MKHVLLGKIHGSDSMIFLVALREPMLLVGCAWVLNSVLGR